MKLPSSRSTTVFAETGEEKVISRYSPEVPSAVQTVSVLPSRTLDAEFADELAVAAAFGARFSESVTSRSSVKMSSSVSVSVPPSLQAAKRTPPVNARTRTSAMSGMIFFLFMEPP